jgi:hypothetical protein
MGLISYIIVMYKISKAKIASENGAITFHMNGITKIVEAPPDYNVCLLQ